MRSLLLVVSLFAFNANAALIEIDWINTGDNLLTQDSQTKLEWMDINPTYGISWNQMGALFSTGELYEGFRYATSDELVTFLSNAGVSTSTGTGITNIGEMPEVQAFIEMVGGGTRNSTGQVTANGAVWSESQVRLAALSYYETGETLFNPLLVEITNLDRTDADGGIWIVRDVSAVPVPGAVWLFGSGLIGLIGLARCNMNS